MDCTGLTLTDMLPASWPPKGWSPVPGSSVEEVGARMWLWDVRRLSVAIGVEHHSNGACWLHTSIGKNGGRTLPSWDDLAAVKRVVHEDRLCVQILPPLAEYVNLAEVLHLWERLDEPTLPPDVVSITMGR